MKYSGHPCDHRAMRYLLILFILSCCGQVVADATSDLKLEVRTQGETQLRLGDSNPSLSMKLRNESKRPIPVVKPGDGSESGWREPNMYFSAEKRTNAGWEPVKRQGIGRCGLYDADWQKDVVMLEPGKALDVGVWMPPPSSYFQLSPGVYRFRLHYEYTGGKTGKASMGTSAKIPKSLAGHSGYSLISNPVTYTFRK